MHGCSVGGIPQCSFDPSFSSIGRWDAESNAMNYAKINYFIRNARVAVSHPMRILQFLNYHAKRLLQDGNPRLAYRGVSLRGFTGFSEYITTLNIIDDSEYAFLTGHRFEPGLMIDVGANVGLVTLILAKRYSARQIVAFEPNPATFDVLRENVRGNHACNVVVEPYAITATPGLVQFNTSPTSRATAHIASTIDPNCVEVPGTTLDEYWKAASSPPVALLKVDVEGYEELVLRGAQTLLRECSPVVYFEVCPGNARLAGLDAAKPAQMLTDSGYRIYRLHTGGTLVSVEPQDAYGAVLENWVALKPEEHS